MSDLEITVRWISSSMQQAAEGTGGEQRFYFLSRAFGLPSQVRPDQARAPSSSCMNLAAFIVI